MRARILAALLACCATAALADAHSDRQALMRANNAAITALDGQVTGILKPDEVKRQAQTLVDNGAKMAVLFAPSTDQNDAGIKPELWSDAAGFAAANDKFIADARTFLTAPDRIAMAHSLVTVQADCAACHKAYRVMPVREARGERGACRRRRTTSNPVTINREDGQFQACYWRSADAVSGDPDETEYSDFQMELKQSIDRALRRRNYALCRHLPLDRRRNGTWSRSLSGRRGNPQNTAAHSNNDPHAGAYGP